VKKAHLFTARASGESRTTHAVANPACGARIYRSDTKPVRGLTTKSKEPCTDCVIAEIRRVANSKSAIEKGDR
jgi:hypothetical protein